MNEKGLTSNLKLVHKKQYDDLCFEHETEYATMRSRLKPGKRLYQTDFKNGTYNITQPGRYILAEDIVFDFGETTTKTSATRLGYFSGICIQCSGVLLEGNGHTLQMSESFWRRQRFFAHIQLNAAPFANSEGPVDFGNDTARNNSIVIATIQFGLTSHHGILGNSATSLSLIDLKFKDFEVAAISTNGCDFIYTRNVFVENNLKVVPYSARFSQAINLLRLYDDAITQKRVFSTEIQEWASTIRLLVEQQKQNATPLPIFANQNVHQLPDCGVLYGINMHTKGIAVNAFDRPETSKPLTYVILRNLTVQHLQAAPVETLGLWTQAQPKKPLIDAQGSMIVHHVDSILKNPTHPENALWSLSIALSKLQPALPGARPFIPIEVDLSKCQRYRCGDSMNHFVKGLIGVSLGSFRIVYAENVQVKDLSNVSAIPEAIQLSDARHTHDFDKQDNQCNVTKYVILSNIPMVYVKDL